MSPERWGRGCSMGALVMYVESGWLCSGTSGTIDNDPNLVSTQCGKVRFHKSRCDNASSHSIPVFLFPRGAKRRDSITYLMSKSPKLSSKLHGCTHNLHSSLASSPADHISSLMLYPVLPTRPMSPHRIILSPLKPPMFQARTTVSSTSQHTNPPPYSIS